MNDIMGLQDDAYTVKNGNKFLEVSFEICPAVLADLTKLSSGIANRMYWSRVIPGSHRKIS